MPSPQRQHKGQKAAEAHGKKAGGSLLKPSASLNLPTDSPLPTATTSIPPAPPLVPRGPLKDADVLNGRRRWCLSPTNTTVSSVIPYDAAKQLVRPSSSTTRVTAELNMTLGMALRISERLEAQRLNDELERRRRESTMHEFAAPTVNDVVVTDDAKAEVVSSPDAKGKLKRAFAKPPLSTRGVQSAPSSRRRNHPSGGNVSQPPTTQNENIPAADAVAPAADAAGSGSANNQQQQTTSSSPIAVNSSFASHESNAQHDIWKSREAVEQALSANASLGYGRKVVSYALLQTRIDNKIAYYRDNVGGALNQLTTRVRETVADRELRSQSSQQLNELMETATREAIEAYKREHPSAKEVPYAVIHSAKVEVTQAHAAESVRSRTSPEKWREKNTKRQEEQKQRLKEAERQRNEMILHSVHRHEEFVAAAEAKREAERASIVNAEWVKLTIMALTGRMFLKKVSEIRVHHHLTAFYEVQRRYLTQWMLPAMAAVEVNRRRKLLGKLKFAFCASRLLGYHIVRKNAVRHILSVLQQRKQSQILIQSVHNYLDDVKMTQRIARKFLAYRRCRLVMLLMQWDMLEEEMRQPNFSIHLGRCVVTSSAAATAPAPAPGHLTVAGGSDPRTPGPSSPRPMSSTKSNVSSVKRTGGGKASSKADDANAASVDDERLAYDLVHRDSESYIPTLFEVRLAAVKRLWREHIRSFQQQDQAALYKLDCEDYDRAMHAFNQLPAKKQIPANLPKKPKYRSLPLFVRRSTMMYAIQPYLEAMRGVLQKIKAAAAKDAVQSQMLFEYPMKRDALIAMLVSGDGDAMRAFEAAANVTLPRGPPRDKEALAQGLEDRFDHMTQMIVSRSKALRPSAMKPLFVAAGHHIIDEVVSSKAVDAVQRHFLGDVAFLLLAKRVQAVMTKIELDREGNAEAGGGKEVAKKTQSQGTTGGIGKGGEGPPAQLQKKPSRMIKGK